MTAPSFTIVMTVFGRPELVLHALFCVVEQSHRRWDLRVYADGAHPRVQDMLREFSAAHADFGSRIAYVELARVPDTWGNPLRRRGLADAAGDYTVFLGHDCLLLPDYLAGHAETIAAHGPCVSVVDVRHWTTRTAGDPARPRKTPGYTGVWPLRHKDVAALGPHDGIDLTSLAFPTRIARAAGVFAPELDGRYGADYDSFDRCRARVPAVHRPGVLCAHF
jgi:hypothetical protein